MELAPVFRAHQTAGALLGPGEHASVGVGEHAVARVFGLVQRGRVVVAHQHVDAADGHAPRRRESGHEQDGRQAARRDDLREREHLLAQVAAQRAVAAQDHERIRDGRESRAGSFGRHLLRPLGRQRTDVRDQVHGAPPVERVSNPSRVPGQEHSDSGQRLHPRGVVVEHDDGALVRPRAHVSYSHTRCAQVS